MILHHTASKDTYITNKIVAGPRRAYTSNVGYASTIDIFKLHNETSAPATFENASGHIQEVSRGLIYFDHTQLMSSLTGSGLTVAAQIQEAKLILRDVQGSQVAPENFRLDLIPLDQTWSEGIGDDVISFSQTHACNWLSASLGTLWDPSDTSGSSDVYGTGNNWSAPGGWFDGDNTHTDYQPGGSKEMYQSFVTGEEDLEIDVTTWLKAVLGGSLTNYGFILKLGGTHETETKSHFVKRFASRHTRDPYLRPKLQVKWHDYHEDHRLMFEDNRASQKLSIRNYSYGSPAAPLKYNASAAAASDLKVRLLSGSWYQESTAVADVTLAGSTQTGFYEATFAKVDIYDSSGASALATKLKATGSIELQERWYSGTYDGSDMVIHYSGSVNLKYSQAVSHNTPRDFRFSIVDLKKTYPPNVTPTVRLFVRDRNLTNEPVRIPIQLASIGLSEAYYRIKDSNSKTILIPFSHDNSSTDYATRLSRDGDGMYFSFPTSVLPQGKTYSIDIKYKDRGQWRIWESHQAFRVS